MVVTHTISKHFAQAFFLIRPWLGLWLELDGQVWIDLSPKMTSTTDFHLLLIMQYLQNIINKADPNTYSIISKVVFFEHGIV